MEHYLHPLVHSFILSAFTQTGVTRLGSALSIVVSIYVNTALVQSPKLEVARGSCPSNVSSPAQITSGSPHVQDWSAQNFVQDVCGQLQP